NVARSGTVAFPDHDAGFRRRIHRVQVKNARSNLTIAAHRLVGEAEGVRVAPDVRAGGIDAQHVPGGRRIEIGIALHGDRADLLAGKPVQYGRVLPARIKLIAGELLTRSVTVVVKGRDLVEVNRMRFYGVIYEPGLGTDPRAD